MRKISSLFSLLLMLTLLPFATQAQCGNCGDGNEGAFNATSNTTISAGLHNYTSFTIAPGVTVRATGTAILQIMATGNVDIQGTLDVSGLAGADGVTYINGGLGALGVAGGGNGGNGSFASGVGPLDGTAASGSGAGAFGAGWSGGGGAGYVTVGGSSGGVGGLGGSIYGDAQLTGNTAGSGGGGGSGGYDCGAGGGGAGGGFVLISSCGTITVSGTINANGGNGGSDGTGNCGGGGGGSGGSIWLTAATVTNNGTLTAAAGLGGASAIPGSPYYGVGGAGSVGRIRVDATTVNGSGAFVPPFGFAGGFSLSVIASVAGTNASCFGVTDGSALANVQGGTGAIQYAWNTGATTPSISGLPAGCYNVVVTDSLGCTDSDTICLTEPTALSLTSSTTDVLCNGDCNGEATVDVTGGTPGYIYGWSNGSTVDSLSNLCAGTYTATITDVNGCSETVTVTVAEPTAISISETHTDATTGSSFDGSATAIVTGGTPGYTYLWTPGGGSTATITNLGPSTYVAEVTDSNGCTDTIAVTIGVLIGVVGQEAIGFDLYPNPTSGAISLRISLPQTSALSLDLMDLQGKCVFHQSNAAVQTLETSMDLGDLAAGVYQLRLTTESSVIVKRVTVSR